MSLLGELRRRKILQVATVYAVVAWLLIQIVATVEAPLNLPDWADTLVIVLLAVGFPITLIVSWGFNLTAEGLVRDEGAGAMPQARGRTIEIVLIALLVVGVLWVIYRVEFDVAEPVADSPVAAEPVADVAAAAARPDILRNSIAVLPFENLSPDPDNAYFAAGIHEEILNQLAKIRDLNVIARTSVFRYADNPPPIPEIAAALRVQAVMEGSVRYAGDKVRVAAQLVDGASGAHLWSEAYDGDLSDIFSIQADIAATIASALETELLPETRARLEKAATDSPAAYALFLQAKDFVNNTGRPGEAIATLDRAIALDPEFAMAHAYKGYLSAWAVINATVAASGNPEVLENMKKQVLADADRALALDQNLGLAWAARAMVNRWSWHWKSAEEDFSRALALSPNDTNIIRDYGQFKAETGRCEEGLSLVRRQAALDPNLMFAHSYLLLTASYCGRFDEALAAAENGVELAPGNPMAIIGVAHTYVAISRDAAKAAPLLRTAEELVTDQTGQMLPGLLYSYGLLGLDDDARRVYERFVPWSQTHTVGAGEWIEVHLGLGNADMAYEWLHRAVEHVESGEVDPSYISFQIVMHNVQKDPRLDEPRFRDLFEKIDTIAKSR